MDGTIHRPHLSSTSDLAFLKEQQVRRVLVVKDAENSAAGRETPEERTWMGFHGELPGWNGMRMQTAWATGERGRRACWLHESGAGLSEDGPPFSQDHLLRTLGTRQAGGQTGRAVHCANRSTTADPTATEHEDKMNRSPSRQGWVLS